MTFTAADIDADWELMDGVKHVTVELRTGGDIFGAPQPNIDALSLVADNKGEQDTKPAGMNGTQVYEESARMALRAFQVTGTVTPGTRITDWDGRVWYVDKATYRSANTRVVVDLQT